MPKLAIYVPKKEMRQIEKWRKRINFSKMFMRALEEEIRQQSRLSSSGDELAAAADFYRRKLAEDCQPLEDAGYELGSRHVLQCRLVPDQIRRMLELAKVSELSDEQMAELEKAIGEDRTELDDTFEKLAFDFPAWRTVAYRGYAAGVAAVWQQLCERMS